jgi:uncharacterized protein YPO0396
MRGGLKSPPFDHKYMNFEKAREIYNLALECEEEREVVEERLESLNKKQKA